ncbi:ethanolamine utilization protein EutH, partial [Salmonella enterica subsp. enterica serovar Paratyphi B]|uniref:ethanolamine utilization protein EutH n=1 Tax=Salmonella enterica TaxID=28901 RepID=UPI0030C78F7C
EIVIRGRFEEGFMAMGALGLAMVGMTALAPVLAHVLGPVIIPVYEMLGANPSMFALSLITISEPTRRCVQ